MCYHIKRVWSYRIIDPIPETIVGQQQSLNGPYDNLFSSVTISPLSYVTPKRLNRQYNPIVPPNYITLYNSNEDNTIELVDGNITSSIYNSPQLWIVQFYAHWCGHCQRFAPTWKNVANHFRGKNDFFTLTIIGFIIIFKRSWWIDIMIFFLQNGIIGFVLES